MLDAPFSLKAKEAPADGFTFDFQLPTVVFVLFQFARNRSSA